MTAPLSISDFRMTFMVTFVNNILTMKQHNILVRIALVWVILALVFQLSMVVLDMSGINLQPFSTKFYHLLNS
jgi:hypothetical protein